MAIVRFELKDEHLKLLKYTKWSLQLNKFLISVENPDDDQNMFLADDVYEAIDLILNGKPTDFDPLNTEESKIYDSTQKKEWDNLLSELPTALEIILNTQEFKLGHYIKVYHELDWKWIK